MPYAASLKILIVACLFWLVAGLGALPYCSAQTSTGAQEAADSITQDDVNIVFNSVIQQIKQDKRTRAENPAEHAWESLTPYVALMNGPSLLQTFRAQVQEWRTDVQTGGPASSPGSTSLVSNGSVPSLLGFAVENGALTQTTSGTSITFRTNPTGLIRVLQKQGYAESGPESYKDPVIKFISKTSAAVTFNTGNTTIPAGGSQGGQAGVFTGSPNQISSFNIRYDIINHRDPRDRRYNKKWTDLRRGTLTQVANALGDLANQLERTGKYDEWRRRTKNTLDGVGEDGVNAAMLTVAEDFVKTFGDDPAVQSAAGRAYEAISNYLQERGVIRNIIDKSPVLTFEYTDIRQSTASTAMALSSAGAVPEEPGAKLPDFSTFRLIVAGGTVGGATLTANASFTLFNANPQGTMDQGRLRDFQLGGQVDVPLREVGNLGVPTLTFSGLFLSLRRQPLGIPVQVNGVNVDLKGNMSFAQAKLSFPLKKGSGIKVPLSITYASRTELIKESDVRGSIGVTLDLDSIFAGMKP